MHGRLKVRTSAEQAAAKQKERDKKIKIYDAATKCIFTKRESNEHDKEALHLTEQLLSANPDFGTLWNFRREIFLKLKEESGFDDKLEKLCKKELMFLQACLQVNPKSYGVWHHRQWINEFLPSANWQQELVLCDLFLSYDERNFHCWDYRRTVVKKAHITPEEEFKFSTDKIAENFSNYSSWHYRSKLLPLIHPDPGGNPERIEEGALLKEFELAQNAFFTDPNDQSAWFYHRWLLGRAQIPLDITCMYVRILPEQAVILVQFSQPVKVLSLGPVVKVNDTVVKETWRNAFSNDQPCHIWICCFLAQKAMTTVMVTMTMMDTSKTIYLQTGDSERWEMSSDCHLLRAELTATHNSLLENELESCKMLLEEEPDNKWTILTLVLLMRALDALTYGEETDRCLIKLQTVDPCRRGYYNDLRRKFQLENTIERYWDRGCADDAERDQHISLTDMGLTHLNHLHQLMLLKTVDLSANNLTNLDQCNMLQCVEKLIVSDNKLRCVSNKYPLQLHQLRELVLVNNNITDVNVLGVLKNCPRLMTLDLQGNEVCGLVDYRHRVKALLPSLVSLDNESFT